MRAGFVWLRSKDSHRIYQAGSRRVVVPFHGGDILHPRTVREVLEAIEEASIKPIPPD